MLDSCHAGMLLPCCRVEVQSAKLYVAIWTTLQPKGLQTQISPGVSSYVSAVQVHVRGHDERQCDVTTSHLDLSKVGLLLAKPNLANLCVYKDADDCSLLPQLIQISLNGLAAICILLAVMAESLLLALVPGRKTVQKSARAENKELCLSAK